MLIALAQAQALIVDFQLVVRILISVAILVADFATMLRLVRMLAKLVILALADLSQEVLALNVVHAEAKIKSFVS